jgi:hypothetical protein
MLLMIAKLSHDWPITSSNKLVRWSGSYGLPISPRRDRRDKNKLAPISPALTAEAFFSEPKPCVADVPHEPYARSHTLDQESSTTTKALICQFPLLWIDTVGPCSSWPSSSIPISRGLEPQAPNHWLKLFLAVHILHFRSVALVSIMVSLTLWLVSYSFIRASEIKACVARNLLVGHSFTYACIQ